MNKAIARLLAGFRRFHEKNYLDDEMETNHSNYQRLVSNGQTPKTLLIGCSDSRVDPAILTGAHPGELFVVRNVANLIPPCEPSAVGFHGTSSAIEFAVTFLKVENIIILGHRQCGGIRALMRGAGQNSFIAQWMSIMAEAREIVLTQYPDADDETRCRHAEMEALKVSYKNVHTFPFVKEAVESRNMNVLAVYFDMELGQLWVLDGPTQEFRQFEIAPHHARQA